ncbi:hypothetical protein Mapa_008497 [Marchantia paleacea]|nr:hypothetical protein Mapa_008497 [Marchantia paleacea]
MASSLTAAVRSGLVLVLCMLLVVSMESSGVRAQEDAFAPAPAPVTPESAAGSIMPSFVAPVIMIVVSFLAGRQ